MNIKKDLLKRQIAGETILIPVGKTVYDSHGMFALNELGSFLWERLPDAADEEDLVEAVAEEYAVAEETARRDIAEFLNTLREMGIL